MTPPGLAFASVSERALAAADARQGGRFYFDWGRTAKSQAKGASPFTPAVSLFLGLDVALGMIEQEGLENVWARHELLARATRAGALALGLELFGDPDERSTVVTAIELPGDVDGAKVPGTLRKLGITANGGQDDLEGPHPADRALRLLRRVRHPHLALRPRDRARPARPPRRARRRRRRRPARVRRGRRARHGVTTLGEQYRVLVAEEIADSGVALLRERFAVDVGLGWSRERAAGADRRLSRDRDPLGDAARRGADRARGAVARDRAGGDRRRQRRRRGGDQARDRGRERAAVEHRRRGRAHDRVDAGAGAQHPAGARVADGGALGALRGSAASRSTRRRSGCSGSGGSVSSSRRARGRSGCGSWPSIRSSRPSASASSAPSGPRRPPTCMRRRTSSRCICRGRRRRAAGWMRTRSRRCATACGSSTARAASSSTTRR